MEKHPSVKECCVIGAADADLGEVPVAFIVAQAGATLNPEALRDHVTQALSRVYAPARIYVLPSLPTGSLGKVDRNALKRMAAEPDTAAA